ncbi:MAG: hypothetical protein FWD31_13845 [Planctomycetaceae bacterium]|nr:hypothetical protein [Planctomycetaceae bacterium]
MKKELIAVLIAACVVWMVAPVAEAQLFGRGGGMFRQAFATANVCESGMCPEAGSVLWVVESGQACEPVMPACEPVMPACEPVVPACEPAVSDCAACARSSPVAARPIAQRPFRGMVMGRAVFGRCCR